MPRGANQGYRSRWWMSQILMNDVYQLWMIMNDILNLNNRVRLFQTQICVYNLSTSCRNPHAVIVRLAQGGEVGAIPVKTACTIE